MASAAFAAQPFLEYGVDMIMKPNKDENCLLSTRPEQDFAESVMLTRKDFLSFFIVGGIVSLFSKKVGAEQKPKEAMFWKRLV